MDRLQNAMPSILEGYCNKSDKPREIAEEEAKTFLKVIEDASSYMFGYNHSIAYCMLGYLCLYFRYYYPIEFLTAFFNCSKFEEDITNGTELAKVLGVKIYPPKFRHSKSKYFMDKEHNAIYKGVGSIKYMNSNIAEELYELRSGTYNTFSELLFDIAKKTTINSRQLEILIKLDFFSEFGNSKELLAINEWFNFFKQGEIKTIKKEKIKDQTVYNIIKRYSKETATGFKIIDVKSIINETEIAQKSIEIKDFSYKEKILTQIEYYGYIDMNTGDNSIEERTKLIVLENIPLRKKKDNSIWAYKILTQSIGSGKHGEFTILGSCYKNKPIKQYDIIKAKKYFKKEYNGKIYWYLGDYDYIF